MDADVLVVGAGLAGMVAAAELTRAGKRVALLDLDRRALDAQGERIPGLYAAGEVAGFGGGGIHGYNALESSFLGGCLFSGRAAGRRLVGAL